VFYNNFVCRKTILPLQLIPHKISGVENDVVFASLSRSSLHCIGLLLRGASVLLAGVQLRTRREHGGHGYSAESVASFYSIHKYSFGFVTRTFSGTLKLVGK
jgi:hypothetical protein